MMHLSGDNLNYIVEIDTSQIPGRVLPIVTSKDWKALIPDLDMLNGEASQYFSEAIGKSNKKQEYLVLYRGLLDPSLLKVLPKYSDGVDKAMPLMFEHAKALWIKSVIIADSKLQGAGESLTQEIADSKLQGAGESQQLKVKDKRDALFSPPRKTRSSASSSGQDSFALSRAEGSQQNKRLKQTEVGSSLRMAHSQSPLRTAHSRSSLRTAHSLPRHQEGSVQKKEEQLDTEKAPNMKKAQMIVVEQQQAKEQYQEQQQSKQQKKNEASAQEKLDSPKISFQELWRKQQEEHARADQEKQQRKQKEQEMTQRQNVKMALDKQEAQQKQKDQEDKDEAQRAEQHKAKLAERAQAKEAAEQAAAEEEQWHEVQGWLASNGFTLPIAERPATPQCFKKDLVDIEGFTPLQRACKVAANQGVSQNSVLARVLEYFLSGSQPGYHQGELDAPTPAGARPPQWAPIHLLAEAKGAAFLVQKLISAEADVAQQIQSKKSNALFRAAGVGNLEIAQLLIGTGKFDKWEKNWNNKSYVDCCQKSNSAVRLALEAWGVEREDIYGKSGREADPLHARKRGQPAPPSRQARAERYRESQRTSKSPNRRRSLSPDRRRSRRCDSGWSQASNSQSPGSQPAPWHSSPWRYGTPHRPGS